MAIYILTLETGEQLKFFVGGCARLYQGLYGGVITVEYMDELSATIMP